MSVSYPPLPSDYRKSIAVKHAREWTSLFTPRIHALGEALCQLENAYFVDIWPFASAEQRQSFVDMDLPRCTAMMFPEALDSRILVSMRLNTLFFLLDDAMDRMGSKEGQAFSDILEQRILVERRYIPGKAWASILLNLVTEIEAMDAEKGKEVFDRIVELCRAQATRSQSHENLAAYLSDRDVECGAKLSRSLAKWAMDVIIPDDERPWIEELERNFSAHCAIVNDLFSWDKETLESRDLAGKIGETVFNAVTVHSKELNVDVDEARFSLANMVRELELIHCHLVANRIASGKPIPSDVVRYVHCLEDIAAANESWSRVTSRYNVVGGKLQKPTEENIGFRKLCV
ncbi:Aristolochene synthase [Tolypocladium paradoxum]|uniref:Terpene synthase n=1 Tax=Tolypocladium paradoxum TaxID=94208 RepID=A0A2S4L703_9HYPO|nr:Aristolochene synthase [Tolypocladium paradoxum]